MKLTYELSEREKSQVLLKVTIDKDEVKDEYEKLILEIQPKVEIDGFRKGKVPRAILEAKFKPKLLADVASRVLEKAYEDIMQKVEKKPISFSIPKIENFKIPELDSDYTFEMSYDVFPTISIGDYKKIEVEINDIKITEDDLKIEIENYIKDFATIKAKDGAITDNDVVTLDYTVNLDGAEYYKGENETVYIGKDYDLFKLSEDIKGLKKGDEKEFTKSFSDDAIDKLANKTFNIKLKINEVKEEVKPELTLELIKQIDEKYETVEQFKKDIEEQLTKAKENLFKQKVLEIALDKLIETFNGEIPDSMIEEQKESYYRSLVRNLGGDEKRAEQFLKWQKLTKDSYKANMQENALKEIKKGLIINHIREKENITTTDDDVKNYITPYLKNEDQKIEDVLQKVKQGKNFDAIKEEIEINKVLDYLYATIKIKKDKKISITEFVKKYNKSSSVK